MSAWFRFCICSFEGTMNEYSSLAQSVEHAAVNRSVVGSSPTGGVFYTWLHGQAVKTPPFHGGNTSSILVRVTKQLAGVVE